MDFATDETGFAIQEDPTAIPITPGAPPEPTRRKRRTRAEMETATLHAEGATDAPEAAEGEAPKRRKTKASREKTEVYARQIFGFYQMGAMFTGAPFMAISEGEAKQLAIAALDVADQFDIEVGGKYAALGGLIVALAVVNIPRGIMLMSHLNARKAAAKMTVQQPVPVQPYAHNAPVDPGTHVFDTMPKVEPGAVH